MDDLPNNVIEFKRKEEERREYVWQCGICEGQTFYICKKGDLENLECTDCGNTDLRVYVTKLE